MSWESQSSAFWFQASGIHVLVVSLKSPSSTWTGALGPTEGLRGLCWTVCVSLEEKLGLCLMPALFFPTCFPSFHQQLFESALWNAGKVQKAKTFFLPAGNGGRGKAFVLGQAPQVPVMGTWFISIYRLSRPLVSLFQWVLFSKWLFSIFQASYFFFHISLIISIK